MCCLQYRINNYKKRNIQCDDITPAVKRRKVKQTSSYNLFSKDFNRTGRQCHAYYVHVLICALHGFPEEACGKTFGERAALMAEKWRSLPAQEKEVYSKRVQEVSECPMEALSFKEKKDIMMRIAKRHQADVGSICVFPMQLSV